MPASPANRWTATTCWRSPNASARPWSARQGKGPTLLECISYRLCDHTTADDASRYRSAEEVNQAWREEPIKRLRAFLAGRGQWDEEREQALVGECQARVQEAVERFETFAAQAPQALFEHVYARWPAVLEEQREQLLERAARRREGPNMNERNGEAKRLALLEAVNLALHRAMAEDETVVVLGEDVGVNGGVFRATLGLRERFGFKRVLDTPLAENMIAGLSIGMAAQGLKPVMEIQFMGFIYAAMEQLVSHASRLRNRTRGRLACPLVLRTPMGAGIRAPEHHSEATEAMFAHIPGVRVLVPSSPARAYGLLLAAIDDPDPVIFLEPTRLYRMNPQPLVDDARRLPLDSCFTLREGGDLTLVSWGASVHETQQAAERLAQRGIEAEVIDVACLKPLDLDTLEASVRKTGRCVIVHEAPKSGGLGGEIAASLYERVLFDLRAPIQRVAAADIPPPLYRLEPLYMPAVEDILAACDTVLGYA